MTSEAWYRRYFGADYLRIYRLADTAEQLAMLARLLPPPGEVDRLLDLPCGHGRHSVALAERGYRVIGLDLSPVFLDVARHAAAEHEVDPGLVRGDMRRFPFADGAFDLAICLFNSLGYFEAEDDNQRVLAEFGRTVRPGGRLLLDLANIDHVRRQPSHSSWTQDGVTVSSEYQWDEASHRAITRRRAVFREGREERYVSSVRLYEAEEIAARLDDAGWTIAERYGAYSGGPVTAETPRRILDCRRKR